MKESNSYLLKTYYKRNSILFTELLIFTYFILNLLVMHCNDDNLLYKTEKEACWHAENKH